MLSLAFGLVAALGWGTHDFCVRPVSKHSGALPALLMVLLFGAAVLAPFSIVLGDWSRMTLQSYALSAVAGGGYVLGGIGLFNAFAIGPVRLVAPITAAYPVLSVGWAALNGAPVALGQWLAVLAVVAGISAVAIWSADDGHSRPDTGSEPESEPESGSRRRAAMLWAGGGAFGFALTFAAGQAATAAGDGLPVLLTARLVTIAGLGLVLLALRTPLAIHRPHLPLLALMGTLDVTSLGFVLAASRLPHPEYAAVAASVFGVITILLAWRFRREPMGPRQWFGVGVVFAGIGYLAI